MLRGFIVAFGVAAARAQASCEGNGFVFHAGQLQLNPDSAPSAMQEANAGVDFVSVAETCCTPCAADPECEGFLFIYPERCLFKSGPMILGANLQTDAAAVGLQGGLYTQISPRAPPTPSSPPSSSPPMRHNVRHFVSFGAIVVVLIFGSSLMIAVYLQRGIVLTQASVVINIKETPAPLHAARATNDVGSPLPSATVSVPLDTGAMTGLWVYSRNERKQHERNSLLGP